MERCYGIVGDTLNQIAHRIDQVAQSNGSICGTRRPERSRQAPKLSSPAGNKAFRGVISPLLAPSPPAQARATVPGSLHFISLAGFTRRDRNRAPVILIASQIVRQDLGFRDRSKEVDFVEVYRGC